MAPTPDLAPSEILTQPSAPVAISEAIQPVSMHIYIAGPLTAPNREQNVEIGMTAYLQLLRKGHYPFLPHFDYYADNLAKRIGRPVTYEQWMELDFAWIPKCDAMLRLPGASSGADREVAEADRLNIPVYTDISQIPNITGADEFGPAPWTATRTYVKPRTHCKTCGDELGSTERRAVALTAPCRDCQGLDYNKCPDCKNQLFHPGCSSALADLGYDRICSTCVRTFVFGDPRTYGRARG